MRALMVTVVVFALGCGATQEKPAITAALKNDDIRAQTFEATARALDEHPEWVDEFYKVARHHPAMMHRFLENSARDLYEKDFARDVGRVLAENPKSLERVFDETVDAANEKPASRKALLRGVRSRSAELAGILLADEETLRVLFDALSKKVGDDKSALQNVLKSVGL
jgi:hypothetical protein